MAKLTMLRRASAFIAAFVSLAGPLCASEVLVVAGAPGPGVDFTDLQSAVDAAENADVLLIKSGVYPAPVIVTKSLTLIADQNASVLVLSHGFDSASIFPPIPAPDPPHPPSDPFVISDLPSNGLVLLYGLEIIVGAPLSLTNNSGSIWLERCTIRPGISFFPCTEFSRNSHGIEALNCDSVTLLSSSIKATTSDRYELPALQPRHGISAENSNLHIYDSLVAGGDGLGEEGDFPNILYPSSASGSGVSITGGSLYAAGTEFRGGDGCKGGNEEGGFGGYPCGDGGDGGIGLELNGAGLTYARFLDSLFTAGAGGAAGVHNPQLSSPCLEGSSGTPIVTNGNATEMLAGNTGQIIFDSPLRGGQSVMVSIEGDPSDFIVLLFGTSTFTAPIPDWNGILHVNPQLFRTLGLINATGVKSIQATTQSILPGGDPSLFYLQVLRYTQPGIWILDQPASMVIIDSSL